MTVSNTNAGLTSIQTVAFASNGGVQSVGFDGAVAQAVDSPALAKHKWPTFLDDLCRPVTITADLYKRNVWGVGREYYIKGKNGKEIVLTRTIAGQSRIDELELPKLVEAYKKGLIGTSQVQVGNVLEYAKQVARHNARPFVFKFSPEVVTSVYDKDTARKQAMGQALLRLGMASKNLKGETEVSIPNNAAGGAAWAKAEGIVNAIPATFLGTGGFEVPRNGGYPLVGKTGSKFMASNEFISARDAQRKEIAIGHWGELGSVAQEVALAMGKSPIKVVGKGVRTPSSVARTEMTRDYRNKIAAGADPVVRNIGNVRSPGYTAPDIGAPVKGAGKPNTPPPISVPGQKSEVPVKIKLKGKDAFQNVKLDLEKRVNAAYGQAVELMNEIERANKERKPINLLLADLDFQIKQLTKLKDLSRDASLKSLTQSIDVVLGVINGKRLNPSKLSTSGTMMMADDRYVVSHNEALCGAFEKKVGSPSYKNTNDVIQYVNHINMLDNNQAGNIPTHLREKIEIFLSKAKKRNPSMKANIETAQKIMELPSLYVSQSKDVPTVVRMEMELSKLGKNDQIVIITSGSNKKLYLDTIQDPRVVIVPVSGPTNSALSIIGDMITKGIIDIKRVKKFIGVGGGGPLDVNRIVAKEVNKLRETNKPGDKKRARVVNINTLPGSTVGSVSVVALHGDYPKPPEGQSAPYPASSVHTVGKETRLLFGNRMDRVVYLLKQINTLSINDAKGLPVSIKAKTLAAGLGDQLAVLSRSLDEAAIEAQRTGVYAPSMQAAGKKSPHNMQLFNDARSGEFLDWSDAATVKLINAYHRYPFDGIKGGIQIATEHTGYDATEVVLKRLNAKLPKEKQIKMPSHGLLVSLWSSINAHAYGLLSADMKFATAYKTTMSNQGISLTTQKLSKMGFSKSVIRQIVDEVQTGPYNYGLPTGAIKIYLDGGGDAKALIDRALR